MVVARIEPWEAHTPGQFVVLLRRAAAQAHSGEVERLSARMHGNDLPPEELILDLLKACDMDIAEEDRWMRVYDKLSGLDEATRPPPPQQTDAPRGRHAVAGQWTGGKRTAAVGLTLAGMLALVGKVDPAGGPATFSAQPPGTTAAGEPSLPVGEPPTVPDSQTAADITTVEPPGGRSGMIVTLRAGQAWDLDTSSDGPDVRWDDGALQSADDAKRLWLIPSGASPDSRDCTKLKNGWLDRNISDLTAGLSLCVRTTGGHWVSMTITTTGNSLRFTSKTLT
jgi:hypothetical protein